MANERDGPVKILDWGAIYRDSLTREILRSERRRVTILAGLFAFAACVFSFFSFVPGLLDPEFRARFQAQWPWMISLYGAVIAYEWALRAGLGWLIEHRREPPVALRFLSAFFEMSIPTAMLFMAVSFIGPRDALGSPAFLLYFFFILLSILQLDMRLCLFIGLVAAVENFIFAHVVIGTLGPEAGAGIWRTPAFHFIRSLILFVAGLVTGLLARQIKRQVEASLRSVQDRDRAVRIFGQYVSPQIADKLLHQPLELGGELRNVCVMFLDIRNFSGYAARERPEAVMAYLNTLFDFMIDVVNEHHGIVNKFLGDGFMAVFGAPIDDAERCGHAVGAALEILKRLDRLNGQDSPDAGGHRAAHGRGRHRQRRLRRTQGIYDHRRRGEPGVEAGAGDQGVSSSSLDLRGGASKSRCGDLRRRRSGAGRAQGPTASGARLQGRLMRWTVTVSVKRDREIWDEHGHVTRTRRFCGVHSTDDRLTPSVDFRISHSSWFSFARLRMICPTLLTNVQTS